jgi:cell wall-associated NlpC family hydrolase
MIEWLQVVKADIARLDKMSEAEKFRYWCLKLVDVPYVWGAENLSGVDCSGTICFALWMLGYNIRLNAQGLYDQIYVKPTSDLANNQEVMAVFYGKEKMTHVTPVVGRYVILDAASVNEPTRLKTARGVRLWYEQRGYKTEWRQIDWAKVKELSRLDKSSWDVDPALQLLRGK